MVYIVNYVNLYERESAQRGKKRISLFPQRGVKCELFPAQAFQSFSTSDVFLFFFSTLRYVMNFRARKGHWYPKAIKYLTEPHATCFSYFSLSLSLSHLTLFHFTIIAFSVPARSLFARLTVLFFSASICLFGFPYYLGWRTFLIKHCNPHERKFFEYLACCRSSGSDTFSHIVPRETNGPRVSHCGTREKSNIRSMRAVGGTRENIYCTRSDRCGKAWLGYTPVWQG